MFNPGVTMARGLNLLHQMQSGGQDSLPGFSTSLESANLPPNPPNNEVRISLILSFLYLTFL
jgi:hypothetical protein